MSETYGSLFSSKLVREGRNEEAIAAAEKELRLSPDEPEILFNRGQALAALGKYEEAIADFQAALAMDASGSSLEIEVLDDELFHVLRTWATAQKDDPAAAIATVRRYQTLMPGGRHVEDIGKWVDRFNGVETVWVRERV